MSETNGIEITVARLQALLAEHERLADVHTQKATTLRLALELLAEDAPAPVLDVTVTLESVAVPAFDQPDASERHQRRQATAAFLGRLSPTTPKKLADLQIASARRVGIGALARHGYIKKKGNGYVRTNVEFRP